MYLKSATLTDNLKRLSPIRRDKSILTTAKPRPVMRASWRIDPAKSGWLTRKPIGVFDDQAMNYPSMGGLLRRSTINLPLP
jgi:hypothetical protein